MFRRIPEQIKDLRKEMEDIDKDIKKNKEPTLAYLQEKDKAVTELGTKISALATDKEFYKKNQKEIDQLTTEFRTLMIERVKKPLKKMTPAKTKASAQDDEGADNIFADLGSSSSSSPSSQSKPTDYGSMPSSGGTPKSPSVEGYGTTGLSPAQESYGSVPGKGKTSGTAPDKPAPGAEGYGFLGRAPLPAQPKPDADGYGAMPTGGKMPASSSSTSSSSSNTPEPTNTDGYGFIQIPGGKGPSVNTNKQVDQPASYGAMPSKSIVPKTHEEHVAAGYGSLVGKPGEPPKTSSSSSSNTPEPSNPAYSPVGLPWKSEAEKKDDEKAKKETVPKQMQFIGGGRTSTPGDRKESEPTPYGKMPPQPGGKKK